MPNWIRNELYITGSAAQRDAFQKQACGEYKDSDGRIVKADLMFSQFLPRPSIKFLKALYAHEKGDGWPVDLKWQADNWGCKWDVGSSSRLLRVTKSSIVYGISTAWAPPMEFVRRVSIIYPALLFSLHSRYQEGRGIKKFKQGYDDSTDMFRFLTSKHPFDE